MAWSPIEPPHGEPAAEISHSFARLRGVRPPTMWAPARSACPEPGGRQLPTQPSTREPRSPRPSAVRGVGALDLAPDAPIVQARRGHRTRLVDVSAVNEDRL